MQQWIYFVILTELIWALCSCIDKIVISKGHIKSPFLFIVFNGLMNLFVFLLLPFADIHLLTFRQNLIALFSSVMVSIAVTLYYKSVNYDEISRIKIMGQMGPIFILILSFFILGEKLNQNHLTGFLLLLCAGFLVSYQKGPSKISKSFYYILLAMIFGAFYLISAKYIYSSTDFWNAVFWLRLFSLNPLLVLAIPKMRNDFFTMISQMSTKIKGLMLFKMTIDFSAFIVYGLAIISGPLPLISVLANAVGPLFTFLIALFSSLYFPHILKEEIDRRSIMTKIFGMLLVVVGLYLINFGFAFY